MSDLGASPGGAGGDSGGGARSPVTGAQEDPTARHHRQLIELLNELRVGLPGVQVLFAFLLTLPFTQHFSSLDAVQRDIYFLAVLTTALATTFLIAPSSYHRLRWRQHDKARMLETSNRLAIIGISFLALSISAVIYLITSVVYSSGVGAGVAGAFAGVVTWLWFGLPLSRRLKD
jgi:predicted neutral ceramidase superfamily lipid hydrolase